MTVQSAIDIMRATEAKASAFNHASGLIYYDGVTTAPRGAAAARGETLAVLSEESYKLTVAEEFRDALYFLRDHKDELDAQTAREAKILLRDYEETSKIPMDEFVEYQKLINESDAVWHEAKEKSDFSMFEPYLERIVATSKRFAGYYAPEKDPYDVYLDRNEEGLTQEIADKYFDTIKAELVPLIHKVIAAKQIDDSFLNVPYAIETQRRFSDYLMDVLTLDRNHCGIGETEHPFTINFSKYDVRITTHYHETQPANSMYSVIHEGGHALYELHTGDELFRTCLATGTSMGIHESQSRFFENLIGRSRAFIELVHPKMVELFPEQLKGVSAEDLYRAVNKSEPSLVRIEADELTYSMHVLIRYEIEKKLFKGELAVHDVPKAWNDLYREYLGVEVPDDKRGCLQDSHWAGGMLGYFPSYSIGSAYAAQMLASMKKDFDVNGTIAKGDLKPVVDWLAERVYKYGSMLTPAEVVKNACGAAFDPKFYTDYLKAKFSDLYNL